MASVAISPDQWRDTLKQHLPQSLLELFSGASRRELLKQVTATLLVFDDRVVNIVSGQHLMLSGVNDMRSAQTLAQACQELVPGNGNADTRVVLLLPPDEFVATRVQMPGLSRDALLSALQLQTENLLPSFSSRLTLAVNPAQAADGQHDTALWITEGRLDSLFDAFAEAGLFLAGVMPRCLALAGSGDFELLEEDSRSFTRVTLRGGSITQWQHVDKRDLSQDIFARQWQQALGEGRVENRLAVSSINVAETFQQSAARTPANLEYFFFPRAALQAKRQMQKGKRVLYAAAAAGVLLLLGALPFGVQSLEFRRLQANLEAQYQLSRTAREDRAVVQNFEEEWGSISDFPEQDVVEVLYTLQNVLSPDQLSSLELSEGLIRIEGESAEPQAILQRLEQHPMFTEVAFSRATSNSRYYIDLRLSTVNFEGYLVRYFPDN